MSDRLKPISRTAGRFLGLPANFFLTQPETPPGA